MRAISKTNKKGQIVNALQGIGIGVIGLAIVIGVGLVVLGKLNATLAVCPADQPYNESVSACYNSSTTTDPSNGAWVSVDYLGTELGSTGLAGWVPAVIALSVGLLFLGAFLIRGRRSF